MRHRKDGVVRAFVADRPVDDRGAVAVALDELRENAREERGEAEVGLDSTAGEAARAFVLDVKPHLIGVLRHKRMRRIVRSANGVEVRVLHQVEILLYRLWHEEPCRPAGWA